jgi:hypothetical protein
MGVPEFMDVFIVENTSIKWMLHFRKPPFAHVQRITRNLAWNPRVGLNKRSGKVSSI